MPRRLWTLDEANTVLPEVRQLVKQMLSARAEVVDLQPQLWPAVEHAVYNGGSKSLSEATRQILIIQDILRMFETMGIQVKDLNTGLLDFPAMKDERIVLLCWQYDEPSIQFWHDIDTGFGGRQRITEDWE